MSGDITDFFVHTVTVETMTGQGAYGPVYSPGVAVQCYLDGSTTLIRNGDGEQVVAQSRVYCSVADAWKFTPDSRVILPAPNIYPSETLYPGETIFPGTEARAAQVITTNQLDAPGLDLPVHTVVYLT